MRYIYKCINNKLEINCLFIKFYKIKRTLLNCSVINTIFGAFIFLFGLFHDKDSNSSCVIFLNIFAFIRHICLCLNINNNLKTSINILSFFYLFPFKIF